MVQVTRRGSLRTIRGAFGSEEANIRYGIMDSSSVVMLISDVSVIVDKQEMVVCKGYGLEMIRFERGSSAV